MKPETIVLIGGLLIDGRKKEPLENSVVLIKDRIILEAGKKEKSRIPENGKVIDVTGKTVMPGMMDLHVHLSHGEHDVMVPRGGLPPNLDQPLPMFGIKGFAYARRSLEMGFTTLRDAGDVGYLSVALREAISNQIVEGPRIVSSGQPLTCTGGHVDYMPLWLRRSDVMISVSDGVDGVLKAVRQQIKMKTDWVKFFATGGIMDPEDEQELSDEELKALIDEAHSKGKRVCAHCMHAKGTLAAIKAGVDTVEHGSDLTEEIADLMLKKGTFLIPTLYAPYANVNRGAEFNLPEFYVSKCRPIFEKHVKSFRLALEKGVKMALGTDCGYTPCRHGTNAFELELLVQYGMSPMEAIKAATKNGALALSMEDQLGTIEKGKLADLIVIDGNPLEDIRILQDKRKICFVMKEGVIFSNKIQPGSSFDLI
jgi:imidazolonepropionase-like amidohydrolase